MRVLLVDDSVDELYLIRNGYPDNSYDWAPTIYYGIKMLKKFGREYDMVLVDLLGTFIGSDDDLARDILTMHENIWYISNGEGLDLPDHSKFCPKTKLKDIL